MTHPKPLRVFEINMISVDLMHFTNKSRCVSSTVELVIRIIGSATAPSPRHHHKHNQSTHNHTDTNAPPEATRTHIPGTQYPHSAKQCSTSITQTSITCVLFGTRVCWNAFDLFRTEIECLPQRCSQLIILYSVCACRTRLCVLLDGHVCEYDTRSCVSFPSHSQIARKSRSDTPTMRQCCREIRFA